MKDVGLSLKDCSLFAAVDLSRFDIPAPVGFRKSECIYGEESYRRALGVMLSGRAKAVNPDGNTVLNTFSPGDVFGAAAVFGCGKCYVSRIIAETDCSVVFFDEAMLRKIIADYPEFAVEYISFLSGKIRFLNRKLALLSSDDNESCVFRYLSGNRGGDGTVLTGCTMKELAMRLNMGRTSLYRALDTLSDKGLLRIEKKEKGKIERITVL